MIDNLKHNDYEEMLIDNSIDELFVDFDIDTLLTLYFYAKMFINL